MSDELKIFLSLCAGIITGYFGHACTVRRESRSRRRAFSGVMAIMHADLKEMTLGEPPHTELSEFFDTHRKMVRNECAKIRPDIACWKRSRFDCARVEYQEWKKRATQAGSDRMAHFQKHGGGHFGEIPFQEPADQRTPKNKLEDALSTLIKCAA